MKTEARVVSVGRSSMIVHVKAYRQDILSRQFEPVQVMKEFCFIPIRLSLSRMSHNSYDANYLLSH